MPWSTPSSALKIGWVDASSHSYFPLHSRIPATFCAVILLKHRDVVTNWLYPLICKNVESHHSNLLNYYNGLAFSSCRLHTFHFYRYSYCSRRSHTCFELWHGDSTSFFFPSKNKSFATIVNDEDSFASGSNRARGHDTFRSYYHTKKCVEICWDTLNSKVTLTSIVLALTATLHKCRFGNITEGIFPRCLIFDAGCQELLKRMQFDFIYMFVLTKISEVHKMSTELDDQNLITMLSNQKVGAPWTAYWLNSSV